MTGLLEGEVRLIMLQFTFSNIELIPSCLTNKSAEIPEQPSKKSPATGEQFIEEVENVGIADFLNDLKNHDYGLADAYYQIRIKGGQQYAMARFMFSAKDYLAISDEFKIIRGSAELALFQISAQSIWRIKAFLNPFYKEGEAIENAYVISVNLNLRQPLFNNDGQPIFRWEKDEEGKKIGDGPVPLKPKKFLRIRNGDVCVT